MGSDTRLGEADAHTFASTLLSTLNPPPRDVATAYGKAGFDLEVAAFWKDHIHQSVHIEDFALMGRAEQLMQLAQAKNILQWWYDNKGRYMKKAKGKKPKPC